MFISFFLLAMFISFVKSSNHILHALALKLLDSCKLGVSNCIIQAKCLFVFGYYFRHVFM
jgi:hypothetical protein